MSADHSGFSEPTATIQKDLGEAGVEQQVGWNACDHHALFGGERGKPLKVHSEDGRKEIWPDLQNLLAQPDHVIEDQFAKALPVR